MEPLTPINDPVHCEARSRCTIRCSHKEAHPARTLDDGMSCTLSTCDAWLGEKNRCVEVKR